MTEKAHNPEPITCQEAGQRGGLSTVKRYGREHFIESGKRGQASLSSRYTREDRQRWGALGGRPRRERFQRVR